MALLFLFSTALVAYAYVGYPILLAMLSRVKRRPWRPANTTPTVSIIMAVRNEGEYLPAKLTNLLSLEYPADKLQIIVVSDGSTDHTGEILRHYVPHVVPVELPHAVGKAAALNAGVCHAAGEILMLCDVRQTIDPDALVHLASCFADPSVGAASGELL